MQSPRATGISTRSLASPGLIRSICVRGSSEGEKRRQQRRSATEHGPESQVSRAPGVELETCDSGETRSVQIVPAARVVGHTLLEALVQLGRHRLRIGQLGAPGIPRLAKGLRARAMADPENRGEIVALHRVGNLRPVSVAFAPLLVEVVL